MTIVREVIAYMSLHGASLVAIVLGIITVAEMIVRLTPTKKDDTFVERIGKFVRKTFDTFGVLPNRRSGGGVHEGSMDKKDD